MVGGAALLRRDQKGCWGRKRLRNAGLEGLRIFHSKDIGEPIEYSRCLPLAYFNKFVLTQKNFNCFVRYKTTPTFLCKDRRWCPDEAPMFWSPTKYWSRPMLFEKVDKRQIVTFYFKTRTVDVGECRTSPVALVKIAQWSGNSTGIVCFPSFNFLPRCFVIYIIWQWSNKLSKFFTIYHLGYVFHYILFISILGSCTDTQISSPYISRIMANKALPFFVTALPTPFLIGVQGGGSRGGAAVPPGLKIFRANSVFQG